MGNHFHPQDRKSLRTWLENFKGDGPTPCWIIIYKKNTGKQTVDYQDILEEAICFGLIDSQTKSVDDNSYAICLRTRRTPSSWAPNNLEIAQAMIESGKMSPRGMKIYEGRFK